MDGKIAIVTGASSGIGRATASLLIKRGATVILGDVDVEGGAAAAAAMGSKAHFMRLDVSDEQNWREVTDFAQTEFGGLHILVNNAGVSSFQSITDATIDEWTRVFRVNALGPLLGCKYAVRAMKERGGAIVNVSSNSSVIAMDSVPIYTSSKGALSALSMQVAGDCRRYKWPVRCNTVIPGGTRSTMQRQAFLDLAGIDTDIDSPETRALLADIAEPELVANVVVFLASDDAARVNGAAFVADGMQSGIFGGG